MQSAAGGAAAAAALIAITIYVFYGGNDQPIPVRTKLPEQTFGFDGLQDAVVDAVRGYRRPLPFTELQLLTGRLFVQPQPPGAPGRPGPDDVPLQPHSPDVALSSDKCILLDLGDIVPAGAGAAAGGGGGAIAEVLAKLEALQVATAAMQQETAATAAKVDELAAAAPQQEKMTSPSVLGGNTLDDLAAASGRAGVFTFPGAEGPPVLDAGELAAMLAACEADNEAGVVRFLTPKLWDILADVSVEPSVDPLRLLLINSEKFGWMDYLGKPVTPDKWQKPDLYVTWEPFVKFQPPSGKQGTGEKFLFGPLAHRTLQVDGCVPLILEAKKVKLTDEAFGEIVSYHSHLRGRVNGLLFNHTDFWLTEASNGHVSRVEKCLWGQPGTLALLQRHFAAVCRPPPLAVLLAKLLADLGVSLLQHDDSCFLGAGSTGRVFAVQRGSGPPLALKVVISPGSLLELSKEFSLLESAAASGAPVVPVEAGSLKLYPGKGGGYLLGAVGTSIPKPTRDKTRSKLTRDETRRVFDALQRVHAVGIVHGDARLPNVVDVGGSVAWLDFFHAARRPEAFNQHAQEDFRTLAASVLKVKLDKLPGIVGAAVAAFVPEGGSAQTVADAVWAAQP